jgi:hypothetical protein
VASTELAADATTNEAEGKLVAVGSPAELSGDLRPDTFQGTVTEVHGAEAADDDHRVVVIRIGFLTQPPGELSRQDVRVRITGATTGDPVLVVPLVAVYTRADGSEWVTKLTGKLASPIRVKAGLSAGGFVQVEPEAGGTLAEGDLVEVGR